jgi:hypothetical protein
MAMYRQQMGKQQQQISDALEQQRRQVEQLALSLSDQAQMQWRRAIEGMVALPAAIAVGFAAATLFGVAFVTRGFEAFGEGIELGRDQLRADAESREPGRQQQSELPRA